MTRSVTLQQPRLTVLHVIRRAVMKLIYIQVWDQAASMTFFLLLSIAPLLISRALEDAQRLVAVDRVLRLNLPVVAMTEELEALALRLDVPLTAATCLDGTTQHFLATSDGPMEDLDREVSHCQYVIGGGAFVCHRSGTLEA